MPQQVRLALRQGEQGRPLPADSCRAGFAPADDRVPASGARETGATGYLPTWRIVSIHCGFAEGDGIIVDGNCQISSIAGASEPGVEINSLF